MINWKLYLKPTEQVQNISPVNAYWLINLLSQNLVVLKLLLFSIKNFYLRNCWNQNMINLTNRMMEMKGYLNSSILYLTSFINYDWVV